MACAKSGDTVKVHFKGKLDDGTVFDSSVDRDPLQFTIGRGEVIPGFDEAVDGMSAGASKTIEIPAKRAYGPWRKEMVMAVDRSKFPDDFAPEVGVQLQIPQPDAEPISVTVSEISKSSVTLDANHPLAGKDLTFEIELIEIL